MCSGRSMQCVVCRYEFSGEGERKVEESKLLPVLGRSGMSSLLEAILMMMNSRQRATHNTGTWAQLLRTKGRQTHFFSLSAVHLHYDAHLPLKNP